MTDLEKIIEQKEEKIEKITAQLHAEETLLDALLEMSAELNQIITQISLFESRKDELFQKVQAIRDSQHFPEWKSESKSYIDNGVWIHRCVAENFNVFLSGDESGSIGGLFLMPVDGINDDINDDRCWLLERTFSDETKALAEALVFAYAINYC